MWVNRTGVGGGGGTKAKAAAPESWEKPVSPPIFTGSFSPRDLLFFFFQLFIPRPQGQGSFVGIPLWFIILFFRWIPIRYPYRYVLAFWVWFYLVSWEIGGFTLVPLFMTFIKPLTFLFWFQFLFSSG